MTPLRCCVPDCAGEWCACAPGTVAEDRDQDPAGAQSLHCRHVPAHDGIPQMPRLTPRVEFTRIDGSPGTYFIGASETIKAVEAGIQHALSEARAAGGTGLAISVYDPADGRCVYRARVPR